MSNESIWISTDLVLANTRYGEDERVLIMSGDSIDLIEAIADVAADVDVYDLSFSVLTRLRHYVRHDNVHFHDDVYPAQDAIYDAAVVFVPKGREQGRAQLWRAMQAIKPQGYLYIVGPNKGGAKTLIKDAGVMFGKANVLAYKKSHRLAAVQRRDNPPQTYPAKLGDDPTMMQQAEWQTPHGALTVARMAGVFSYEHLDDGTAFLLENIDFAGYESVLDVGCGVGVIGALAARHAQQATLVDDNLLALRCTQSTLEANQLSNASVLASDVYSALDDARYDLIVSNPPFHRKWDRSTQTTERMIAEASQHLNADGRLVIVANAFLKYEQTFAQHFTQSGIIAQDSRFKVIEGIK